MCKHTDGRRLSVAWLPVQDNGGGGIAQRLEQRGDEIFHPDRFPTPCVWRLWLPIVGVWCDINLPKGHRWIDRKGLMRQGTENGVRMGHDLAFGGFISFKEQLHILWCPSV